MEPVEPRCGCGEERVVGGWRLRRDGVARIETGPGRVLLCVGPSEALIYSNAEVSDGGFDQLPHSGGVLELRARLSRLHWGSAGWGFWNYSMLVDASNPVWFIYLNAPGPYPLKGLFAQSGRFFRPIRLLGGGLGDRLRRLLLRLPGAPVRLVGGEALPGLELGEPHLYRVEWRPGRAVFSVDGRVVAELPASGGRARVDIWIDNVVYAPLRGDPGRVYRHFTMELREEACLEVLGV